jgi:long-subunit acyl-CoA synthetase (AMP-forming)
MQNYPTLVDKIYELKSRLPNEVFLRQPFGDNWKEFTYDEVVTEALRLVSAMKASGLKKGDKIGIYSKNCYHWIVSEIAIMLGGFVMVPYYSNLVGDALKEVIELSDIKFLFVGKLENWEQAKRAFPKDLTILKFPHYEGNAVVSTGIPWDDFIEGVEPDEENFRPRSEDIWAVFYTSGTTGVPKGAIMPYSGPANMMEQSEKHNNFNLLDPGKNRFLSYLPLNHIAEQVLIIVGGFYNEGQISFVESLESFSKNLADVQPSVFLAVPRIWTKFRQGVLAKIPQKKLDLLLKIPVVSTLIKKKIRRSLGLSNTKLVASGASALPEDTIQWFKKLDIKIQEAYGLTETMGVVVFDPIRDMRSGKTGRRLEEGQMKIDAVTDEILVKNNWMFTGYYKDPKLTKECFTEDGFYRTGDTGLLDKDDYLIVKGRVKDTFKTTKGKFIIPIPIEDLFATNSLIEMICLVGLGMPQPMALIKLSELSDNKEEDDIRSSLLETLDQVNSQLHGYQMIHKIICIEEEWSLNNEKLTPTMKIKRNVIHESYKSNYQEWYDHKDRIMIV